MTLATTRNLFALLAVTALVAFVAPFTASADVENAFLTVDGRSNTTVEEGDNVAARLTFDRDGEHVESISWELVGSGLPEVCVNIDDAVSSGGTSVRSFTIRTNGATEGTWDTRIRYFGDGFYPDNSGASNLCEPGDRIDVDDEDELFGDRVTIFDNIDDNQDDDNDGNSNSGGTNSNTGGNGGTGTGGNGGNNAGNSGGFNWNDFFTQFCNRFPTHVGCGSSTPAPSGVCAELAAKVGAASPGVYSGGNISLQRFLGSKGASIPALGHYNPTPFPGMWSGGVTEGFYGSQTANAVLYVKGINSCQ